MARTGSAPTCDDPKERWVKRYIRQHYSQIEAVAGSTIMPVLRKPALGCGGFGCVLQTRTPGTVLKASFDREEGRFILLSAAFPQIPEGIVRYSLVIEHPQIGATPEELDIPPTAYDDVFYLLWREEAHFRPGDLLTRSEKAQSLNVREHLRLAEQALRTLFVTPVAGHLADVMEHYKDVDSPGQLAEEYSLEYVDDVLTRTALLLLDIPHLLRAQPPGRLCHVWRAVEFYVLRGLLTPDVHWGNIGAVRRGQETVFVIIDPSLVVDFTHLLPGRRKPNPLPAPSRPLLATEIPGRQMIRARAAAPRGNPLPSSEQSLLKRLEDLRPVFTETAQAILDSWQQDEHGIDEELGQGGPCDRIASDFIRDIYEHLPGVEALCGGMAGEDHEYIVAYSDTEAVIVDLPFDVYETGGGYRWTKKPDVRIRPDDFFFEKISRRDIDGLIEYGAG